ncbi:MAG: 30S ribosomal protein S5 [Candidatus Taylorbacteria bacterium]|nr:30S ribosomal protein S5 [Candidatus Taylorbacteria bacterium]
MEDEIKNKIEPAAAPPSARRARRRGDKERRPLRERARPEFDQKILSIRRVTRVSAGGRRFNFSAALIAGDRKGGVGVGLGKGGDTAIAIDKAMRQAKKNLIKVSLTPTKSIGRRVEAKYSSARVFIFPAPGHGLVAGSALRAVLELAGVKDVTGKIISTSKNKLNIARAAVAALSQLK